MIRIIRTTSENTDFQELVKALDKELAVRDGDEHSFFAQFNKTHMIKHVVLGYLQDEAVACGAIKEYNASTMEIKRMFVPLAFRGNSYASLILTELENWARELGYKKCILETGLNQPEAIRLYEKNAFIKIPNYGQYAGVENSVCFEKIINL